MLEHSRAAQLRPRRHLWHPGRPRHFRRPRAALALALLTLSACSLAPEAAPVAPVEGLPEAFAAPGTAGSYEPLHWWRSFDDPVLDRLLDTVLVANLDLAEALGRVRESRALAGVALADLLPQATLAADVNPTSNPNNAGFALQIGELLRGLAQDSADAGDGTGDGTTDPSDANDEGPPSRFNNTNYNTSLNFSWELDLWGRARNDRAAAVAELGAAEADLHAARITVLSETVTAYFEWLDVRQRVALTDEIVGVLGERVALTQQRYDRGLVTSFELYQIRQEWQAARAGLPQLRTQQRDAERRLALLAGRHAGDLAPLLDGAEVPEALPLGDVTPGAPADLLAQRPDVWAAARRFHAARLRVGARRAELLPGLQLSGTVGLQSADAGTLLRIDQWFGSLVSGLTAPLFQGGRLRSNLSAAEARYAQQLAVYARTVLTAVGEVELALTRHSEERTRWQVLDDQLQQALASVALQADRYASGVADYPDYLDALRNELTVRSTISQARRDVALARLAVHRALGGAWTHPDTSEPEIASEPAEEPGS